MEIFSAVPRKAEKIRPALTENVVRGNVRRRADTSFPSSPPVAGIAWLTRADKV